MIPENKLGQFQKLRPIRKMIVQQYYLVREKERKSHHHIVKKVAIDLGYSIDTNGRSSYVSTVIREFI